MAYLIPSLCTAVAVMCLIIWRLKSKNNHLTAEKIQLKQGLNAIKTELDNVKLAKKITKNNHNLSNDNLDQCLQDGGYFRGE